MNGHREVTGPFIESSAGSTLSADKESVQNIPIDPPQDSSCIDRLSVPLYILTGPI